MPEGPSLVILREETARFEGQEIISAEGNTTPSIRRAWTASRSCRCARFGKQFIIELPDMALRVHFMLFGSYRIDERKDRPPRLALAHGGWRRTEFLRLLDQGVDPDLDAVYDWSADVMSDAGTRRRR